MRSFQRRSAAPIAAVAVALLSLAGCGSEAGAPGSASKETSEATEAHSPKLTLADLPAPYNEADLSAGKIAFSRCVACHKIEAGEGDLMGPNLHGVFARKPGSKPGFRYTPAMIAFDQSTTMTTWTPEEVDKWLQDPEAYLPDSGMKFNGVTDPEVRRDLIAWLMIESSEDE